MSRLRQAGSLRPCVRGASAVPAFEARPQARVGGREWRGLVVSAKRFEFEALLGAREGGATACRRAPWRRRAEARVVSGVQVSANYFEFEVLLRKGKLARRRAAGNGEGS